MIGKNLRGNYNGNGKWTDMREKPQKRGRYIGCQECQRCYWCKNYGKTLGKPQFVCYCQNRFGETASAPPPSSTDIIPTKDVTVPGKQKIRKSHVSVKSHLHLSSGHLHQEDFWPESPISLSHLKDFNLKAKNIFIWILKTDPCQINMGYHLKAKT